ncbi:MAG TPA: peroxiredoxin [Gammaproteobacteria bacterium]|jgi:peroxiredoxin Q/BCP
MLKIGDTAPDFSLPDHSGQLVRLHELLARGPVLLYFYPADFTPVCTREACAFSAVEPELARAGVSLIGISPQDAATHLRFRERYSLPFPLLADPEKRVIRAYGCNGLLGFGVSRVTYLIGKDGRIREAAKAALRVAPHLGLAKRAASSPK